MHGHLNVKFTYIILFATSFESLTVVYITYSFNGTVKCK